VVEESTSLLAAILAEQALVDQIKGHFGNEARPNQHPRQELLA